MNVLFGTKLTPESHFSHRFARNTMSSADQQLMMHHVSTPYTAFADASSSGTFDWRRTGIVVSADWFVPKKRADIVGNVRAIEQLERWVQAWRRANSAKTKDDFVARLPEYCCAFLRGPPGTSKLTTVNVLLRQNGYTDIVHIDAGAMKSKQLVTDRLIPLLLNAKPGRAIVIDEVDGLHFSGGAAASNSDPLLVFLSGDTHKVTWGEQQKLRTMARGGMAAFLPYYDEVAEARLQRGQSGCVTPCPVILIASDHQYQFVFKSLERVCGTHANTDDASFFLFRPVRTEDIERRYAMLAAQYNFFTRGKNVADGKADWLVLHDLATVAGGDIRKAITMLTATVRRAYADKQARLSRGKDEECADPRLVLRRRHCEALLRNQLTVQTSPFQACSFLLHDCPSVRVAIDHIARFRMNNVPDMLFGGFHKITPVAKTIVAADVARTKQKPMDVEWRNDLAALVRLVDTADAFSRADSYRQRFDYGYVESSQTQEIYHDSITMWSFLLLNPDQGAEGYVFGRREGGSNGAASVAAISAATLGEERGQMGLLQKRQFCTNFSNCRKKDCNCRWMQKASLEAQRGQRAQWDRMRTEERNQYDQKTEQTMQTSSDRFLYFRNYVNSVQQVRAKGQQLATIDEKTLVDRYATAVDASASAPEKPKQTAVANEKKEDTKAKKPAAAVDNASQSQDSVPSVAGVAAKKISMPAAKNVPLDKKKPKNIADAAAVASSAASTSASSAASSSATTSLSATKISMPPAKKARADTRDAKRIAVAEKAKNAQKQQEEDELAIRAMVEERKNKQKQQANTVATSVTTRKRAQQDDGNSEPKEEGAKQRRITDFLSAKTK